VSGHTERDRSQGTAHLESGGNVGERAVSPLRAALGPLEREAVRDDDVLEDAIVAPVPRIPATSQVWRMRACRIGNTPARMTGIPSTNCGTPSITTMPALMSQLACAEPLT
jgi:hypothetical protein